MKVLYDEFRCRAQKIRPSDDLDDSMKAIAAVLRVAMSGARNRGRKILRDALGCALAPVEAGGTSDFVVHYPLYNDTEPPVPKTYSDAIDEEYAKASRYQVEVHCEFEIPDKKHLGKVRELGKYMLLPHGYGSLRSDL